MSSQTIFGNHNLAVLIKDSPNCVVQLGDGRRTAEFYVPERGSGPETELELLLARNAVTTLVGRDEVWRDTLLWCEADGAFSIRCVTGRGGAGKTRLAIELVDEVRKREGWDGRFVRIHEGGLIPLWLEAVGSRSTLMVFDYAAENAREIGASLHAAYRERGRHEGRRLRVLLLARAAAWEEGWLKEIDRPYGDDEPLHRLCVPRAPVELGPLGVDERVRVFRETMERAAAMARVAVPAMPERGLFSEGRAAQSLRDPLTLMMAAVVGVKTGVPAAMSLSRAELAEAVAEQFVERRLERMEENQALAKQVMAVVTLCGGMDRAGVLRAVGDPTVQAGLGSVRNPVGLFEKMRAAFPDLKGGVDAVRPDIVGEAFVMRSLEGGKQSVLWAAETDGGRVAATVVRMVQDFALAEGGRGERVEPLEWLRALIDHGIADDLRFLLELRGALPKSSVVMRGEALRVRETIADHIRRAEPDSEVPDENRDEWRVALAFILNELAMSLGEVGERERALSVAEESVALYRVVTRRGAIPLSVDLACALNTLANRLGETGRISEHQSTAAEAVRIIEELPREVREQSLAELQMCVETLAAAQREAEDPEAISTAAYGVKLARMLEAKDHEEGLPRLAMALHNYAAMQHGVGLREEALSTAEEAARLRRALVAQNRDAFLPGLSSSLKNLAAIQSEVGRLEDALSIAEEAAGLCGELVARFGGSFAVDLGRACGTLGSILLAMERFAEAAARSADGLAAVLPVCEQYPQALGGLAEALEGLYLRACEQAELAPDLELLRGAARALRVVEGEEGE